MDALPDELRQEILAQHVRDQQIATRTNDIPANISADFLNALPDDLREEILQQERAETARREREAANRNAAQPGEVAPSVVSPTSFLDALDALDPDIRNMMQQDQDFRPHDILDGRPPRRMGTRSSLLRQGRPSSSAAYKEIFQS